MPQVAKTPHVYYHEIIDVRDMHRRQKNIVLLVYCNAGGEQTLREGGRL